MLAFVFALLLQGAYASPVRDAFFNELADPCSARTVEQALNLLKNGAKYQLLKGDDDAKFPLRFVKGLINQVECRIVDGLLGHESLIGFELGIPFSFKQYLHQYPLPEWITPELDRKVLSIMESVFDEEDRPSLKEASKEFRNISDGQFSRFCRTEAFNIKETNSSLQPYVDVWRNEARLLAGSENAHLEKRKLGKWIKKKFLSCVKAGRQVIENEESLNNLGQNVQSLHLALGLLRSMKASEFGGAKQISRDLSKISSLRPQIIDALFDGTYATFRFVAPKDQLVCVFLSHFDKYRSCGFSFFLLKSIQTPM